MSFARASSLPAGNPFWSENASLRFQVAAARPRDLPVPSDDELEEGQSQERGRTRSRSQLDVVDGVASSGRAEVETGASRTSFATALRTPTSWIRREQSVLGRRTEGLIPPDESQPNGPESLENELGKVMYEQLADENELLRREIAELKKMEDERKESERLRAELEGLKRKIAGQEGSSSTSWSEVGWKSIMANRRRRPRECRSRKLVKMIGDSHLEALRFLPVYLLMKFQDHHSLLGRLG